MNQYNLSLMNKSELKKLSKDQVIDMLLKERKAKFVIVDDTKQMPAQRIYKSRPPIPTPRKNVKKMVQNYENNIILPPLEFRDKPTPRIYKARPPIPTPRTKQMIQQDTPVPAPRTKIKL